jgi:phenylalanyl-tRNA synthetase alpha chain
MREKIAGLLEQIQSFEAESREHLEAFRIQYLSKKGLIPALFNDFKQVAAEDRKEMGMLLNNLKQKAQEILDLQQERFVAVKENKIQMDTSLPAPACRRRKASTFDCSPRLEQHLRKNWI